MKVAIVVDGLQVGGIERVCLDYCKIFSHLGYEVTIFNLMPKLNELEFEVPSKCKIVHVPFSTKITPERYTNLIRKNMICKFSYSLIYFIFTIFCFFYKFFCKLVYPECRAKYDFSISFSSHLNDLTFVAHHFIKAKHLISWCHGAIYSYLLMSDGFINLYKKIKNIIVLVDDAQDEVLMYNKQLDLNMFKLYNPSFVQLRSINSEKVRQLKKKYGNFFLMVSRFQYPHKDQFTVVRAFNWLLMNHDVKGDLIFVGDGPDKKRVKELVDDLPLKIKKRIHFLGVQLDVQNYYKAAFALVHASVAGEGLPTIMIEAMHYGLPEIVTDSKTGPREILGDNEYGLLCKTKDYKDMGQKMYSLYVNQSLYSKYQKKERERVQDFTPQKIEKKLKQILQEIGKN